VSGLETRSQAKANAEREKLRQQLGTLTGMVLARWVFVFAALAAVCALAFSVANGCSWGAALIRAFIAAAVCGICGATLLKPLTRMLRPEIPNPVEAPAPVTAGKDSKPAGGTSANGAAPPNRSTAAVPAPSVVAAKSTVSVKAPSPAKAA